MERLPRRRRAVRWARYANRYAHNHGNTLGGWAIVHAMNTTGRSWRYVRRQAKHTWTGEQ